ncbi:MAG: trehalose-phosphatase [Microthrixaceae bacterium]
MSDPLLPTLDAVVFDTDGVLTQTASIHVAAWKAALDPVLAALADGAAARPLTDADYRHHIDGIGRYDGVAALLASRGIDLPLGDPDDAPGHTTVCAVGNLKNQAFTDVVAEQGVEPYLTTRRLIDALHDQGVRTAAISASRNCRAVLEAAGMLELFQVILDGNDVAALGLAGKPDPAIFVEAANRLGAEIARTAVVEDAEAGVRAGRDGGFGLVVGIDRTRHPDRLADADIVVPDAADLRLQGRRLDREPHPQARLRDLPDALDDADVARMLEGRPVAVFLDYDGTLTPIVPRPQDALLPADTRAALVELAQVCTVGIISGRDLDDVAAMIDVPDLWIAGSHGFDVRAPDGARTQFEQGAAALPALDAAELALVDAVAAAPGARVERKRFAIAVHYREVADDDVAGLQAAVQSLADGSPALRMTGGKLIFELRPAADWHKGAALSWLLEATGGGPDTLAVFVGDDVTDEDAFARVRPTGLGVVVGDEARMTAAHCRLDEPERVAAFLAMVTAAVRDA